MLISKMLMVEYDSVFYARLELKVLPSDSENG